MRGVFRAVSLGALTLCSSCQSDALFVCNTDDHCAPDGRCEATQLCSFPDTDCPSGWAYGKFSGAMSNQCVDPTTAASTGALDDATTTPSEDAGSRNDEDSTGAPTSDPTTTSMATTTNGVGDSSGTTTDHATDRATDQATDSGGLDYQVCPTGDNLGGCQADGSGQDSYAGTVMCGALEYPTLFDVFVIEVDDEDCVHVRVDNDEAAADLMAYLVDASGDFYGIQDDYSQLDDERRCSTVPWNGYACPEASVQIGTAGAAAIAVGQWPGNDCQDFAGYVLSIAINGEQVDLSSGPELDDTLIDVFDCSP
jgi:hypothetical protein